MYLPDPYKLEVIKFLDSDAGKAFVTALSQRAPQNPDANLPHSTKLSTYDQRAGFYNCMTEMTRLPKESPAPGAVKPNVLFDPRD